MSVTWCCGLFGKVVVLLFFSFCEMKFFFEEEMISCFKISEQPVISSYKRDYILLLRNLNRVFTRISMSAQLL